MQQWTVTVSPNRWLPIWAVLKIILKSVYYTKPTQRMNYDLIVLGKCVKRA